jgi:hypothetical protein
VVADDEDPRAGFILASIYAVLGVGQLVSVLLPGAHVWNLVTGVLGLVLAAAYLASAAALFRRERSRTASATPGRPGLPSSS